MHLKKLKIITRVLSYVLFIAIWWLPFSGEVYAQDGSFYYQKFKELRTNKPDSALLYAKKAVELSRFNNDSLLLVKALNAVGWLEKENGNYNDAIDSYLKAYNISAENHYQDQVKYLSNNLGLTYCYNGDYDKALKYHLISLEIRDKEGNEKEIAITRNNLGLVYYNLNHYKMALDNYMMALAYFEKVEDIERVLHATINIGLCYQEMRDFDNAKKYYSAVEASGNILSEYTKLQLYGGFGTVYLSLKDFEKAHEYFKKSEEISLSLNEPTYLAISQYNLAAYYFEINDMDNARKYFRSSLENSEGSARWLTKNYKIGAGIEEQAGNFQLALDYYKDFMAIQDSLLNEAVVEEVQNLQLVYAEQQHEKNMSLLDLRLEQNQKINILLVALLFSVGLVAFFSYRASKVRKDAVFKIGHAYKLVERQKDQLEKMVQERTADLKSSNDELANFIYRTSHDIRGPLATLKGICNVALMDVQDKEAINYLEKIDVTSSKLINILARIQNINSIKNYVIQQENIALKKLVDNILQNETAKCEDVSVYNDIPGNVMVSTDSSMLVMGLSNIISNAFKFRKQNNNRNDERPFVKILYKEVDEGSVMEVMDNGAGIPPENMKKIFNLFFKSDPSGNNADSAGIGLHLAKLAIEKIGGKITASSANSVTTFTIFIPRAIEEDQREEAEHVHLANTGVVS